jgi:urea transport system ATP-binding protein
MNQLLAMTRMRFNGGEITRQFLKNHSVVAIEHDMEFVKQIAQRIAVLHQGEKVDQRSVSMKCNFNLK